MGAAYVISAGELRKIRAHLKNLLSVRMPLPDPINEDEHDIMSASGMYVFFKRGQPWPHLYLGKSDKGLGGRTHNQIHLRRWATHLLLFPLPDLRPCTLRIIEKRLLRLCVKQFSWAYLDNERDLSAPTPDPFMKGGVYPDLDNLLSKIFYIISIGLDARRKRPKKFRATHTLGAQNRDVFGLASRRGGWTYLIPGSRISSRYPNHRAIKKNPTAFDRLERFYRAGLIAWRRRTNTRPAGLVVTEPILFRDRRSAARFLNVGEKVGEAWMPIKPRRKE